MARISGFVAWLPPVRRRREDIGILIGTLLKRQLADRAGEVSFSCDAMRALLLYNWPLNVREIQKWLVASVVLSGGRQIDLDHLPDRVSTGKEVAGTSASKPSSDPRVQTSEHRNVLRKREELVSLLRTHKGNVSAVARALGKARPQVQRWLKRYQIDRNNQK